MLKMSDTDSDNQDKDMDVDKFDFLNSYFSEPVPKIPPQCPNGMFHFGGVDPNQGYSGLNQTLYCGSTTGESYSASNFSQLSSSIATPKFSGTRSFFPGGNLGIKNPLQLFSLQNNLHSPISYPSSSITTPEPSSSVFSDGQCSITTPTSSSCSSSDQGGIQTPSNVNISNSASNTNCTSSTPLNNFQGQIFGPNSVSPDVNLDVSFTTPVLDFGKTSYRGSDGIYPDIANLGPSVTNVNQEPVFHVSSNYQVPAPPQYRVSTPWRFPNRSSYLDQLDYCFDSQLSPAPGPRQVCPDELNNNVAVQMKYEIKANPSVVPIETHSPPVAVVLMPRIDSQKTLILKTGVIASKTMRSLKPRVKSINQETNSSQTRRGNTNQKVIPTDFSQSKFKSPIPLFVTKRYTGSKDTDSKSSAHPVFKTEFSPFYSNSTRKVPTAVQQGQNTIPLAKSRQNSTDFWNVELYEDGTEDLFIEKPKRFRGRRRNKLVGSLKVTKTCVDQSNPINSIRIAPPIVSTRDQNVVNKSSSLVQIVKQRKPKKLKIKSMQNEKVSKSSKTKLDIPKPTPPDICTRCEELSLQIKLIQDSAIDDAENNLDVGSGLPSLCEDCGSDIRQSIEGETEVSESLLKAKDNVPASDDGDILSIENTVNVNSNVQNLSQLEEDNEVDTLVIDGDKGTGTQSSKESDSGDTIMLSSIKKSVKVFIQTHNPICWSCKSTESLGSWHAHKWQHEKFLCSSCFNYYKEKNAENSRKEQALEMMKNSEQSKKQIENIQRNERAVDIVKVETNLVPNYSLSLQNLPPGTHDFNSISETELDPISQALREMGEGILEFNVT